MSFSGLRWALNQKPGSLSDRLVLIHLANRCDAADKCWPAVLRLAGETGLSRRSVQCALARLEKAGLIVRLQRKCKSNLYRLCPSEGSTARAVTAPPYAQPMRSLRADTAPLPGQPLHGGSAATAPKPFNEPVRGTDQVTKRPSAKLAREGGTDGEFDRWAFLKSFDAEESFAETTFEGVIAESEK